MSKLGDVLQNALEGGNALKTADLVNLTFTIKDIGEEKHNTFPAEYDEHGNLKKEARESISYLSTIILNGEEQEAWLGGGWLTPQVKALADEGLIPATVKVVRDASKNGNPYVLVEAEQQSASEPPVQSSEVQAAAKRMWARAKELGYETQTAVHSLLGLDQRPGAVAAYAQQIAGANGISMAQAYSRIQDQIESASGGMPEEVPFE